MSNNSYYNIETKIVTIKGASKNLSIEKDFTFINNAIKKNSKIIEEIITSTIIDQVIKDKDLDPIRLSTFIDIILNYIESSLRNKRNNSGDHLFQRFNEIKNLIQSGVNPNLSIEHFVNTINLINFSAATVAPKSTVIVNSVVDYNQQAYDILFKSIIPENNRISLSHITADHLKLYVDDIGETHYIENTNQSLKDNSVEVVNTLFQTIHYIFRNLNLRPLKKDDQSPLNLLFYFLITDEKQIPDVLYTLFTDNKTLIQIYVNNYPDNEVSHFLRNIDIDSFLIALKIWYDTYASIVVKDSSLANVKKGFIAQSTLKGDKSQILKTINGDLAILGQSKIEYGKQIYDLILLSNNFTNYNHNKIQQVLESLRISHKDKNFIFEFDYWQKDAIAMAENGDSFLLVGSTSGGKTYTSMIIIERLLKKGTTLYIAPTEPLAFQIYTNLEKTFKTFKNRPRVGICTNSLDIYPSGTQILIGTPKDLDNVLSVKKMTDKTKEEIIRNLENESTKILFDNIIIDEIHTISSNYDQSIEGKIRSKCIFNLLKCAKSQSQIIGLSATLSNKSIVGLKQLIYDQTRISMKEIIYNFEDIGKKTKNDLNSKLAVKPHVKYIISEENSKIVRTRDKLQTVITDRKFCFNLFKTIFKWGKLPCAIFPGTETQVLEIYTNLIQYLEEESSKCIQWEEFKNKYRKNFNVLEVSKIDTWRTLLWDKISTLDVNTNDFFIFSEVDPQLRNNFNQICFQLNLNIYDKDIGTPEIYGLMYEFVYFGSSRNPFSGKHPYFRFIINEIKEGMFAPQNEGHLTRFGNLLSDQKIDFESSSNSFTSLIKTGIEYGIGLITSSVPFAIQCEIVSYLRKSNSSKNPLPFIFCDTSMSMGISYSFLSVCIIKSQPQTITSSEYFQERGRSGRRSSDNSEPITPEVYLVNILNALELNQLEDSEYNVMSYSPFYYSNPELFLQSVQNFIALQLEYSSQSLSVTAINSVKFFPQYNDNIDNLREKITLMKNEVKEMFERIQFFNLSVAQNYIYRIYEFLQNKEFSETKI